MKIVIQSSRLVRPAADTPRIRLWNSSLDLIIPRIHVPTVYFYTPPPSAPDFFCPTRLRESLAKALVPFYPVAGRLGRDANGRIEIDCNGEGVLFMEAVVEARVADFGDFSPAMKLKKLVPSVDDTEDLGSYPLILLQLTRFKCGGVCLGVGVQHQLADGLSALHFINTWSDICRGMAVSLQPYIDRTLLRARVPCTPVFPHVEYLPPPQLKPPCTCAGGDSEDEWQGGGGRGPAATQKLVCKSFPFTLQQLCRLKSSASDPSDPTRYSSYESLAAHVWRCVCECRGLGQDQDTKLYIPTDGRRRLEPALPAGYFGNVIFTATPTARAGELRAKPLRFAAHAIRAAVAAMDDAYLRSALDFLQLCPDLDSLVRGAHTFRSPNLGITSWVRLPIYDADFGWGRPVFMGPAGIPYEGLAFLFPSPIADGTLTLSLSLTSEQMDRFEKLVYAF